MAGTTRRSCGIKSGAGSLVGGTRSNAPRHRIVRVWRRESLRRATLQPRSSAVISREHSKGSQLTSRGSADVAEATRDVVRWNAWTRFLPLSSRAERGISSGRSQCWIGAELLSAPIQPQIIRSCRARRPDPLPTVSPAHWTTRAGPTHPRTCWCQGVHRCLGPWRPASPDPNPHRSASTRPGPARSRRASGP